MTSEVCPVNKQESTRIESQATPVAPSSLSTRPITPPPSSTNANELERAVSQSPCVLSFYCHDFLLIWAYRSLSAFIDSHNLIIKGGNFNHTLGNTHTHYHTTGSLVINNNINREHCFVSALLILSKT